MRAAVCEERSWLEIDRLCGFRVCDGSFENLAYILSNREVRELETCRNVEGPEQLLEKGVVLSQNDLVCTFVEPSKDAEDFLERKEGHELQ